MNSLRAKVFLGVLSGLLLVTAVAESFLYRQSVSFAEQELFNSLRKYAVALSEVAQLDESQQFVFSPDWQNSLKISAEDHAQFFEITTSDGQYITDSHNLGGDSLPTVGEHQGRRLVDFGNIVLGVYQHNFTLRSDDRSTQAFKLVVAENTDLIKDARLSSIKTLIWFTPLALIAAFIISLGLTAIALSSVSRFKNRVQTYNRTDNRSRLDLSSIDREMKPLGEALNKYIYQLNKQTNLESKLLADTAHELRVPLTTMRKELDELRRAVLTKEEFAINVDSIDKNLSALQQMTDNMLMLYRIESGNYSPKLESFELSTELKRIIRYFKRNENMQVDLSGGDATVLSNRSVLSLIVSQLLNNAARYAPDSPVKISWINSDENIVLYVDDEGPGIPETEREKIFDRHYRFEDSSQAVSGGSGLGLALVRLYANAVGAQTFCLESPQGGARFAVVLNVDTPVETVGQGSSMIKPAFDGNAL